MCIAGFVSIDCGLNKGGDYTDASTGMYYVSDETFIDSGVGSSQKVSSSIPRGATFVQQYNNLRSFPDTARVCYTLRPSQLSVKFLIRASFLYGNYDGLNAVPSFDLFLGVEKWDTIKLADATTALVKEIIHTPSSNYTSLCLVNTGLGTPFISAIEVRPLKNTTYVTKSGSLDLWRRWNFGSTISSLRYPDDVYDRIWPAFDWPEMDVLNTSLIVDADQSQDFRPPNKVMNCAVTPRNASDPIKIFWIPANPTDKFVIYMHFAEVALLQANETRQFSILLNGSPLYPSYTPIYLYSETVYTDDPRSMNRFEFWLEKTVNSTLPPIFNSIEVYIAKYFLQAPTVQSEVDAMKNMKSKFGVTRNWQGDPCLPQAYVWDGLNCSYNNYKEPTITALNLSSSGLTGEIPSYIANLKSLMTLDLSNNGLNGSVPSFLSQMTSLTILNLSGNNLSGPVPSGLVDRSKTGSLTLSLTGNPSLCASTSLCNSTKSGSGSGGSSISIGPIIGGVVGGLVVIVLFLLLIWWMLTRKPRVVKAGTANCTAALNTDADSILIDVKNRNFTYPEVLKMTNNFQTVLGRGGFGTVFLGDIDGTQVAVKMLSASSVQGYRQFRAEVNLLMVVHHRNLTSLVGYCDDDGKKALIYEYMVHGNLDEQLNEKSAKLLSWEERLRIAVDAAQGLEYLHNGCKPPIVHRDVKCANILLNEQYQAKIADFGLSRAFPVEGGTVLTAVAGTPGYLDPEYFVSNRLHEKSDVFSFGVVLMEIMTSRAVLDHSHQKAHISQWVSYILETEGDMRNVIDRRLRGEFDVNSAWKVAEIAMACVAPHSSDRPLMNEVVIELKECLNLECARVNKLKGNRAI
uniref:non-specific serine/threonine protein kinase n=2 Tax=Kalanchoe fedtschenkoi TaxID=63787 RepID=A0A7N1A3L6_KALFE